MKKVVAGSFVVASLLAFIACSDDARRAQPGDGVVKHTGEALTAGTPTIDFDVDAPQSNEIALTFDDGPDDGGYTDQILDILKSNGVKATFFVNTENASDVLDEPDAQATIRRMITDGHQVGNHTVHHYDLSDTSVDVNAEFAGVDSALAKYGYLTNAFPFRLARCPYGDPWYGPQSRLNYVAPIVAEYGVHVGWNIDSQDSDGTCEKPACVQSNIFKLVDQGLSGVVLMHSINPWDVKALQGVIDGLRSRNKKFVTVEDLVIAKYGKPSHQLFTCSSNAQCLAGETCSGSTHHCTPTSGDDGGTSDAGAGDAGTSDSGATDSGSIDSGAGDSAASDSGAGDVAVDDSGSSDAGSDVITTGAQWHAMASTPLSARTGYVAVATTNGVFVWGGQSTSGSYLSDGAFYDLAANAWTKLPTSPLTARAPSSIASDGSRVFLFGGAAASSSLLTSGAIYDVNAKTWTKFPNTDHALQCEPRAVWAPTTSEFIVFGCRYDSSVGATEPEGYAYSPAKNTWRTLPRASGMKPRQGFALAWIGGKMVVYGGANVSYGAPTGTTQSSGYAYDPVSNAWTAIANAPIARFEPSFAVLDTNRLAVFGGLDKSGGSPFADGAIYDAGTGTWSPIPALAAAEARSANAAFALNDQLFVWGGKGASGDLADGWFYDVASSTWSLLPGGPLSARESSFAGVAGGHGVVWAGVSASTAETDGAVW